MGIYFILWVISQYYHHLLCCPDYSSFSHWGLFQIGSFSHFLFKRTIFRAGGEGGGRGDRERKKKEKNRIAFAKGTCVAML